MLRRSPAFLFVGKYMTRAPRTMQPVARGTRHAVRTMPAYRDGRALQGLGAAYVFVAEQGLTAAHGLLAPHGFVAAQGFAAPQGSPAMVAVDTADGWHGLWLAAAVFAEATAPPKTAIVPSAITALRSDLRFSDNMDLTSFSLV